MALLGAAIATGHPFRIADADGTRTVVGSPQMEVPAVSKLGTIGSWLSCALLAALLALGVLERLPPKHKLVLHGCSASVNGFSCTFTNLEGSKDSGACVKGKLQAKSGRGNTVESVPLCSGPLDSRSSKVLTGGWVQGQPSDVCSKKTEVLGREIEQLDWSACDLNVDSL